MGSKVKALGAFAMDFGKQFRFISQTIAKSGRGITTLFKAFGSGIKIAGKGGIKSLLKKIPILGALVGIGFAAKRAMDGDWLGAGMEFLSGIASIFPGVGTAVSVGLDAGLMAMDAGGVTGNKATKTKSAKSSSPTVDNTTDDGIYADDFTIRTNPKDTITMAGGTKLGGNVESLLETLILEVRKGGNVSMDGYKVGEVMALSSRAGLQ